MTDEKAEISSDEAVDTVGRHHMFKKLCSREQTTPKLRRPQE